MVEAARRLRAARRLARTTAANLLFHDPTCHRVVQVSYRPAKQTHWHHTHTRAHCGCAGALETIESVGGRARPLLALLAGWVESWGDRHVQGLFHTRTVGELLWGYE